MLFLGIVALSLAAAPASLAHARQHGQEQKGGQQQGNAASLNIDLAKALVTAREEGAGRTVQFKVTDAALLKSLQVGQKVPADWGAGKVTVEGATGCCGIVSPRDTQAR